MTEIAQRAGALSRRIAEAAVRAGRDPSSIRLMGVTKTVDAGRIRQAYDAGLRLFGENYVKEALGKMQELPPDAEWHMIGHLQSNKAKKVVESFAVLQTLDTPALAEALQKAAAARGTRMRVLLQVNLGGEETKSGGDTEAVEALARRAPEWPNLALTGLMALPPYLEDPEEVRPFFRQLRELAARIDSFGVPGVEMKDLSMGMSHDFEAAVEEGATIVRIGSALFGTRA